MKLFDKIFGTDSERAIKKIQPIADKVLALEESVSKLTDKELKQKTTEFKERLNQGETLDDLLPEAFAVCREASWRVLGMKHFPVQILGGIILHQGRIAEQKTGEGKSIPLDTKIPTPNGWKTAGEIQVGDYLFDREGKPTKVLGVYPQGLQDTYEIELRDGRTVKCNEEHLWTVYDSYRNSKPAQTYTLKEMYEKGARRKRGFHFHLPTSGAVEYPEKEFKLDPYVLGSFLGDGCKNDNGDFSLSSADKENVEEIARLLGNFDFRQRENGYTWYFYNGKYEDGRNKRLKILDIDESLSELLSKTYCHEKYIPEEYKMGSIEQRWSLIQGLMDTDGNIDASEENGVKRYNISFGTSSEKLKNDFCEVIYSLGLTCSVYIHKRRKDSHYKHTEYIIRINVLNDIKHKFFRLSRKKNIALEAIGVEKKKDYSRIAIVDIRKLEEKTEQVCFYVDNEEHLFLVGDYVVTHNTLVATLPLYLNALTGKGVYLVTVNDYLAERDSQQMGKVYSFLGLTTGLIVHNMLPPQKKAAYACDIIYGTNSEFGFDYLRDNMVINKEDIVQRDFNFAIVDEVDSILIDEARTPLIISGFNGKSTEEYEKANAFVKTLKKKVVAKLEETSTFEQLGDNEYKEMFPEYDYVVEEKTRTVTLTAQGIEKAEKFYGVENLSDPEHVDINHYIQIAIKAHGIFRKDIDYVIKDGKVMIVDENTGRIMDGRRYSDGIHQAIEAKENVHIQQESKTLASITYQNLFRKFPKLSGMTGTAMTEKEEFMSIYGLDVVTVPTNKPMIRNDRNDKVYISHKAKLNAIVARVKMCQAKGQPILIGTTSVESSEEISSLFKKHGIKHVVLNAKHHADEAKIVAQAGKLGAVTIATNMAGRGTDIILGGNPEYLALEELRKEGYPEELIIEATSHFETDNADILDIREKFKEREERIKKELAPEVQQVLDAGGLFILGSERHESRRIDNQLRGRSGRQGDMGESEFILSLEDNLMRLFGADKILNLVHTMNLPEEEPIQAGLLSNSIEKAQARVEGQYFAMRKSVLQFDEVLARQRDIVYAERMKLLNKEVDCIETATKMMLNIIKVKVENLLSQKKYIEAEDIDNLKDSFSEFDGMITIKDYSNDELDTLTVEDIVEDLSEQLKENLNEFISLYDEQYMSETFRRIILFLLDNAWQEHMVILDDLKQGINLNAYAQRDPLTTFKVESFELFDEMMLYIQEETLKTFYRMQKTMIQQ